MVKLDQQVKISFLQYIQTKFRPFIYIGLLETTWRTRNLREMRVLRRTRTLRTRALRRMRTSRSFGAVRTSYIHVQPLSLRFFALSSFSGFPGTPIFFFFLFLFNCNLLSALSAPCQISCFNIHTLILTLDYLQHMQSPFLSALLRTYFGCFVCIIVLS
jgi:hypothetical protein